TVARAAAVSSSRTRQRHPARPPTSPWPSAPQRRPERKATALQNTCYDFTGFCSHFEPRHTWRGLATGRYTQEPDRDSHWRGLDGKVRNPHIRLPDLARGSTSRFTLDPPSFAAKTYPESAGAGVEMTKAGSWWQPARAA